MLLDLMTMMEVVVKDNLRMDRHVMEQTVVVRLLMDILIRRDEMKVQMMKRVVPHSLLDNMDSLSNNFQSIVEPVVMTMDNEQVSMDIEVMLMMTMPTHHGYSTMDNNEHCY